MTNNEGIPLQSTMNNQDTVQVSLFTSNIMLVSGKVTVKARKNSSGNFPGGPNILFEQQDCL